MLTFDFRCPAWAELQIADGIGAPWLAHRFLFPRPPLQGRTLPAVLDAVVGDRDVRRHPGRRDEAELNSVIRVHCVVLWQRGQARTSPLLPPDARVDG